MMRWLVVGLVCLVGVILLGTARAESIAELAKKLRTHEDFRVRTQAALALGATASKKAIAPLCDGLDDEVDTVRAASAGGMAKLALGGKPCLERRLRVETSSNVKKMIKKALRLIAEGAGASGLGPSAKFYIAFKAVKNGTGRPSVSKLAVSSMRARIDQGEGFVFAPAGESTKQAKKRLRKNPHVVGYALKPKVSTTKTTGELLVTCAIDLFDYPGGDSLGGVSRSAGKSGIDEDDEGEEDGLVKRACGQAAGEFMNLAAQVD